MPCDPELSDRINSFALVGYIPGELGEFLNKLRQELVSGCTARSHVTVLPPRPLALDPMVAKERLFSRVELFPPVRIEIPRISVWEQTSVVFADIGAGRDKLFEMHQLLNTDGFGQSEQYDYYPHITLAHGVAPELVNEMFELTCRRWQEIAPAQSFLMDTVTFVQNTSANLWIDLAECELRGSTGSDFSNSSM